MSVPQPFLAQRRAFRGTGPVRPCDPRRPCSSVKRIIGDEDDDVDEPGDVRRGRDVAALLDDTKLKQRIVQKEIARIGDAVRHGDLNHFPTPYELQTGVFHKDLSHWLDYAIFEGYHRALLECFLEEHEITSQELVEMRSNGELPVDGNDRSWDYSLVKEKYPPLETYYPDGGPDKDRVEKLIRRSLYDGACSFGSSHHQRKLEGNAGKKVTGTVYRELPTTRGEGRVIAVTPDYAPTQITEDLYDPFEMHEGGPSIDLMVEAAVKLAQEHDESLALYWLLTRPYEMKTNALLRAWGGGHVKNFGAVRKATNRVLRKADDFVADLRRDEEFCRALDRPVAKDGWGGEPDAVNTLGVSARETNLRGGAQT